MEYVEIFDTTLRDGSQLEGISLTVEDKFRISRQLDVLGIHFIEAGWPGANPKDTEFFERAKSELELKNSILVAFGSTRRAHCNIKEDLVTKNLLGAETTAVCLVGKAWDYHVEHGLGVELEEGLSMISDSVSYFVEHERSVHFDAEHFFDGYKNNSDFAMSALDAAAEAGAKYLVLCDTNGGTMPDEIEKIVSNVVDHFQNKSNSPVVSIHAHDDGACAVANALAAVRAGAREVQGTINGYGERTGNCNLIPIIGNLSFKMGYQTIDQNKLSFLTPVAHHVAELVNLPLNPQAAYVGAKAFTHKAGLHTSALSKKRDAYEHLDPAQVGNVTRFAVSEMAGRSTIELKAKELGIDMSPQAIAQVTTKLKELEYEGYHFEVADGSLELLMRRSAGWQQNYFEVEDFHVTVDEVDADLCSFGTSGTLKTSASITMKVDDEVVSKTEEGNGPVNALDKALRSAVGSRFPQLEKIQLVDYKVRVLNTKKATGALTRVLIDTTNGAETWTTIGVSSNIIEASWQALSDALLVGLIRAEQTN